MDWVGFEPTTSASFFYNEGSCPFKSSSLFNYPRAWTTTMKDCNDISLMHLHANQYESQNVSIMLLAQVERLYAIS
jgi:hypothetical protein